MITILVMQTDCYTHSYWDVLDEGPSSVPEITEVEMLVCSWQFQYKSNTHTIRPTPTPLGNSSLVLHGFLGLHDEIRQIIYTTFSSHTSQKIGMKMTGGKKVLTEYGKYKNYWKFYKAYFHTSSHRAHVHTPNVMLPHHHIDFYIFNKF